MAQAFLGEVRKISHVVSIRVQVEKDIGTILETFNGYVLCEFSGVIVEQDRDNITSLDLQTPVDGYASQTFGQETQPKNEVTKC